MRKQLIHSVALMLLSLLWAACEREPSAQQAEKFMKFYGSAPLSQASDVLSLEQGSYAFAGTTPDSEGRNRATLWRCSSLGNTLEGFPRSYPETGAVASSEASTVIALDQGRDGFLLCGSLVEEEAGDRDIYLVRTDASGEVLWERRFGGAEDERAAHAVRGPEGNIILAGYRIEEGRSRIMLMATGPDGDSLELGLNYHNPNEVNEQAHYLLEQDGIFYCLVSMESSLGPGERMAVLSFDRGLSPLAVSFDPGEGIEASSLYMDEDGRLLVLWNQTLLNANAEVVVSEIRTDGLLMQEPVEVTRFTENGADLKASRMIRNRDGGYALAAWTGLFDSSQPALLHLDEHFDLQQKQLFGLPSGLQAVDLDLGQESGYIVLIGPRQGKEDLLGLIKTE